MSKKILLIEDDQILADVLEQKLKREGYEVTSEKDGTKGLAKMRTLKPDLVLLDIVMPNMNGYEVLEAKFKDPVLRPIPVIVISNSGQPVEISRTIALGALDHLVKADITPEEVLSKVRLQIGADDNPSGGTCKGKKFQANCNGQARPIAIFFIVAPPCLGSPHLILFYICKQWSFHLGHSFLMPPQQRLGKRLGFVFSTCVVLLYTSADVQENRWLEPPRSGEGKVVLTALYFNRGISSKNASLFSII